MVLSRQHIMKRKRERRRRKLSLVLIIVGLIVVAIPIAGQLYTSYNENKMIDEWLNSDNAETAENGNTATAAGNEAIEDSYNQLQDIFSNEGSGTNEVQQTSEVAGGTPYHEFCGDR